MADTSSLRFEHLKSLLSKHSDILVQQTKLFRFIVDAKISLVEQIYFIKSTNNKRDLIYDDNNLLISTNPYLISNDKSLQHLTDVPGVTNSTNGS